MGILSKVFVLAAGLAALSACGTEPEKTSSSDAEAYGSNSGTIVEARISYCHDGDTCTAYVNGQREPLRVRMAAIDAPEVSGGDFNEGQPLGKEARNYLNALVKGKTVSIRQIEKDRYGRTVGEIKCNGSNINLKMIARGYAEHYKWFTNGVDKKLYATVEAKAKANHKGIWGLTVYQSPGDFRWNEKQTESASSL